MPEATAHRPGEAAVGSAAAPAGRPAGRGRPRVLLLTASMGAGHVEVAAELARRLIERGGAAEVVDVLAAAPAAGRRLRRTYRWLLRWAPWVYSAAMRFWMLRPKAMERLTAAGAGAFEDAIAAAAERVQPDVVVSTYNLASQCLGRLVAGGRIAATTVTLVSDPGPHPYWVSDRVDVHVAPTAACAAAMRRFGAPVCLAAAPVLRPEFRSPPDRGEARRRLGLAATDRIVLLTAGSWAVGGVLRTLRDVLAVPGVRVVVLCGRDERLLRALPDDPRVHGVGWTTRMVDHLAAADVVVDNAGGLTFWEARACNTPVVFFRPLPGHGAINVTALTAGGLGHRARTPARLRALLGDRLPAPSADRHRPLPEVEELILATAGGAAR